MDDSTKSYAFDQTNPRRDIPQRGFEKNGLQRLPTHGEGISLSGRFHTEIHDEDPKGTSDFELGGLEEQLKRELVRKVDRVIKSLVISIGRFSNERT